MPMQGTNLSLKVEIYLQNKGKKLQFVYPNAILYIHCFFVCKSTQICDESHFIRNYTLNKFLVNQKSTFVSQLQQNKRCV